MCRMPQVGWREQDIGDLRDEVEDDGVIQDTLAQCGLLKLFRIPLTCSVKLLLEKLVIY